MVLHGNYDSFMKILIIGGGYLATKVACYLNALNENVVLATRKSDKILLFLPELTIRSINWDQTSILSELCQDVDIILHIAGVNYVQSSIDPYSALELNSIRLQKLIDIAVSKKVKRLIYFSTAHVYSGNLSGIINETTDAIGTHPYAYTHRIGEKHVLEAGEKGQLESIVVRLSNAFGPPAYKEVDCWNLLINSVCREVVEKSSATLATSGVQHRDFISIEEVCKATHFLINFTFKRNNVSEIFNVGNGVSTSVLGITQSIIDRARILFKKDVNLILPCPIIELEDRVPFFFSNEKLNKYGFKIQNSSIDHIDNMLNSCQHFFQK
jgi:UDP-glucose 4-epimerase